jgi:SH3 domain-containing YSC84-like protein 1
VPVFLNSSIQLCSLFIIYSGADVGVAVGPLGRSVEADLGASPGNLAPIYTYSLSKGLYAGVSLDGKVIVTRHRINEKFYGREVSGMEILQGVIPSPPAARPLYDALARCHVYATGNLPPHTRLPTPAAQQQQQYDPYAGEYGETPYNFNNNFGSTNSSDDAGPLDQHSYAGMSDITSDPGY